MYFYGSPYQNIINTVIIKYLYLFVHFLTKWHLKMMK